MVENITISGPNQVSISKGKTSRLSGSIRNSQSFALFNKPTRCSLFFVSFALSAVCSAFTNHASSFFSIFAYLFDLPLPF